MQRVALSGDKAFVERLAAAGGTTEEGGGG
jgi:hypothetical protein